MIVFIYPWYMEIHVNSTLAFKKKQKAKKGKVTHPTIA